ncbi:MAG: Holliday junction resolvase RuvX [Propionibacteriaceae bacterium]
MCLCLDWGQARIGVAACGREGLLSYPVETVVAGSGAVSRIIALVAEYEPQQIIVGLPRTLAGDEGLAAQKIRESATELAQNLDIPMFFVDERMTTASATKKLQAAGRNSRKQRAVIDQAAAVAILESALERYRRYGEWGQALVLPQCQSFDDKEKR